MLLDSIIKLKTKRKKNHSENLLTDVDFVLVYGNLWHNDPDRRIRNI